MTKEQLLKFIKIRNSSGYSSNLQFSIDAEEAGFKVEELGAVEKVGLRHAPAYHWQTPWGTLIETGGELSLREGEPA
jgi:hypothetical protein